MKRQDANLEGCRHLGNISRLPGKKKRENLLAIHTGNPFCNLSGFYQVSVC